MRSSQASQLRGAATSAASYAILSAVLSTARAFLALAACGVVVAVVGAVLFGMVVSSNPVDTAQILGTVIASIVLAGGTCAALWRWGPAAFSEQRTAVKELSLGGSRGIVPRLSLVSLADLGVRDPRDALGVGQGQLPYAVRQELDPRLEDALRSRKFVLVHGPSAAGKSRSTAEAARRLMGGRPVLIPACHPGALASLLTADAVRKDTVIWLSDLQEHISAGVDAHLLGRALGVENVTIVSTIRDGEYQRLVPHGDLRPQGRDVIELAIKHGGPVRFEDWNDVDRQNAVQRYQWLRRPDVIKALASGRGLGEYLVAGPEIIERLEMGRPPSSGVAVVRAATDWYRAGLTRPAPVDLVRELYSDYLPPDAAAELQHFEDGLRWACEPVSGSRTVAEMTDGTGLVVHDYVLDHWPVHYPRPIPEATWAAITRALQDSPGEIVVAAAAAAERHESPSAALRLLRQGADRGDVFAMYNLGVVLIQQKGDVAEAERLWRIAVDAGIRDAAYNLGVLLDKRGDEDEATHWWTKAARAGDLAAMFNLGITAQRRNDVATAELWWHKAAEAGHLHSARNLADVFEQRSEPTEAERWLRVGVEGGDAKSMNNLGSLFARRGDFDAAEQMWVQAATRAVPDAMSNLGIRAKSKGDLAEAQRWWQVAAASGYGLAMQHLADLLKAEGDPEAAEAWLEAAAEAGRVDAMNDLALALHERGQGERAETWWRAAADRHLPDAMSNLAALLFERGDVEEAERLWQDAAASGSTEAMNCLAFILASRRDFAGAEALWRAAAEAGVPEAMTNLATLLVRRGDANAEQWWQKAAEVGDADAMYNLGVRAATKNESEQAASWWRAAAAIGHLEAAKALELGRPLQHGDNLGPLS